MAIRSITKLRLAAGHVKTVSEMETQFGKDLLRSPVSTITVGSITVDERLGNPEPHYGYDSETRTSYNAVGLKNPGWKKFFPNKLKELINIASKHDKQVVLSLAPIEPGQVEQMVKVISAMPYRTWVSRIQLNGGCPNVSGHEVIAHDPEAIESLLSEIKPFTSLVDFEFKTSPQLSKSTLRKTVELCSEYGIKWIVSANTEKVDTPTGKDGNPYTGSPACGKAGLPLFEQNVEQVVVFSDYIRQTGADIKLVACGGIFSAEQLMTYADAGAVEAEMMTSVLENSPKVFQDILMATV